MSTPRVNSRASPSDIPIVPKVTINAGILAFATRKPFNTPQAVPAATPHTRPTSRTPGLSPPTATMAIAAMTPENTRTPLMDKSIPPVRITNVLPTARTRRMEALVAMFITLATLGKASGRNTEKNTASATRTRKSAADWLPKMLRSRPSVLPTSRSSGWKPGRGRKSSK